MKKKVFLHGYLAEKFGSEFEFEIPNARMAVSMLGHQLKGFWAAIEPGTFRLVYGKPEAGPDLSEDQLELSFGSASELHIIPWVAGAGGGSRAGGIVKLVLGVALLATGLGFAAFGAVGAAAGFGAGLSAGVSIAGATLSYGTIALIGAGLTIAGISAVTAPRLDLKPGKENYDTRELADQRPSFLLNAPTNRFEQGSPVPVVYGQIRTGSVVVSLGLTNEAV